MLTDKLKHLNFKTDLLPFFIATIGEFIALAFWLYFNDKSMILLANLLLWTGFMIERIAVILWLGRVYRKKEGISPPKLTWWQIPLGLIAVTWTEILVWFIWLYVAENYGGWWGLAVLMPLMLLEHSAEMGLVKRCNLLKYVTNGKTIFFTIMEVAGAVGWLHFVREGQPVIGIIILLLGLSIEHIIQGSELKPYAIEAKK
jgi:hypothetical protein